MPKAVHAFVSVCLSPDSAFLHHLELLKTNLSESHERLVLGGDFIGRKPVWFDSVLSRRGKLVETFVNAGGLHIGNDAAPAFFPLRGNKLLFSVINLTLFTGDLLGVLDRRKQYVGELLTRIVT